jgi:hypothetical protein
MYAGLISGDRPPHFEFSDVIAWEITRGNDDKYGVYHIVFPIWVWGTPLKSDPLKSNDLWLLRSPDGVFKWYGLFFDSEEKALAHLFEIWRKNNPEKDEEDLAKYFMAERRPDLIDRVRGGTMKLSTAVRIMAEDADPADSPGG